MGTLSKKRGFWAVIGAFVLGSSPLWHLIGRVSEIDFLAGIGATIGPHMMSFLASWGWLISVPLGVLILFLSLKRPSVFALQVDDREDAAGAVAVREWVDLAKENDQRARGLEEQLARAHVSGEQLMATSNAMGASITDLVASNKELAKLMQDNLKLAEDMRAHDAELADRSDAAYRTLSNMHLALSDETPEPDLSKDRDRIILARLYAYQFHEALAFYLTAAEAGLTAATAGGPWPHLSPEAAARFRAIPEIGKPPQLLSTLQMDTATRKRLRQRLAKLARIKPSASNPSKSSGPDSAEPPSPETVMASPSETTHSSLIKATTGSGS